MSSSFRPYKRKRKGAAGGRKSYKRSKPIISKAAIKSVIRSEMETKHVDAYLNTAFTEAVTPGALSCTFRNEATLETATSHMPRILSGASAFQRVGNKVFLKSMQIRFQVSTVPNFEVVASRPTIARVVVVQFTDSIPNASGFLDNLDSEPGLSPVLAQYKTTTNTPYRILYDRVFTEERVKGFTEVDVLGTTTPAYAVGGESWYIHKTFKINRELSFGSNASTAPLQNPIAVYAFADDDNVGTMTPTWYIRGTVRFSYKDA